MSMMEIANLDLNYLHWLVKLEPAEDARRGDKMRVIRDVARKLCTLAEYKRDVGATTMPFGKYQGQSLAEIAKENPKYLDWVLENCERIPAHLREDIEEVIHGL
jgi:hypothetical protein